MKVIKNEYPVPFDVEQTLIDWHYPESTPTKDLVFINGEFARPIKETIREVMLSKARGFYTIVWSAAGRKIAEATVKALKLEKYVDVVMAKPKFYYDDRKADDWMNQIDVTKKTSE